MRQIGKIIKSEDEEVEKLVRKGGGGYRGG